MKKAPMINTLADMDKTVLEELFELFIGDINQIEFIPNIFNLKELSPRHRELIFAGSTAGFWKAEKALNSNTAKKKKQLYLKSTKGVEQSGFLNEELTRKFVLLLC